MKQFDLPTLESAPAPRLNLTFAYDIGHSSIGWAVLDSGPNVLGCGSVIFPPDDCLASERRVMRRMRRQFASRRNRVNRLKAVFNHAGLISSAEADENDCAWPWLLAARALRGLRQLEAKELWQVLRWYAHNRGYDGNVLWAGDTPEAGEEKDEAKRVEEAKHTMREHGTETMAETMCAVLGIDPAGPRRASRVSFKALGVAFPRSTVVHEVRRILALHGDVLDLPEALVAALLDDHSRYPVDAATPPKRYHGGYLFGQLKPRFNNRIIPACPVSGLNTPLKHCREYYHYRWGRLLNNVRVLDAESGKARLLTPEERDSIHGAMKESGFLDKIGLRKALREATGAEPANLDGMFMTTEMEEALVLNPVDWFLAKNKIMKLVWPTVPEALRPLLRSRLWKGKAESLARWRTRLEASGGDIKAFDQAVDTAYKEATKKKGATKTRDEFAQAILRVGKTATGRSPYSRQLMWRAFEECLAGVEPTAEGGCLYETEEIRERRRATPIDQLTNNHLLRHRMLILERLMRDMLDEFAGGDAERVKLCAVEVVRDFQEFSGLSNKEKESLLNSKLGHHRKVSKVLEEKLAAMGRPADMSASLIRRARVLDDLGWTCPYTGQKLSLAALLNGELTVEHIIPRSVRPSDSLDSIVMTFREVNDHKGNRTALQYIEEFQGQSVPGLNHDVVSLTAYEKFVKALKSPTSSSDDRRRCQRRKKLMLTRDYNERGGGFTERDLTVSSQVAKLAARQAENTLGTRAVQLPGSVTAATRRSWRLAGCLGKACPETLYPDGNQRPKHEIREITHLHHALDAVAIGLAATIVPPRHSVWELLSRRRVHGRDQNQLRLEMGGGITFSHDGSWDLAPLPKPLAAQLSDRLSEARVVRHQPSAMGGLKVLLNTHGIRSAAPDETGKVKLRQRSRDAKGNLVVKHTEERASKLLGWNGAGDGKLATIKGARVIDANFGVALTNPPRVIPHHKVFPRLGAIEEQNGGKWPTVLRNGDIIEISGGKRPGRYRVFSIKDAKVGILLDLAHPELVKPENKKPGCWMNANLKSLLKHGLRILPTTYTGKRQ